MTVSDAALSVRAEHDALTFSFDDRQWRVRGLETQHSGLRLRVNLLVARQDLSHVDTLDLYTARQRYAFLKQAAAELYVDEAVLKRDLGRVLWQLEEHQEAAAADALCRRGRSAGDERRGATRGAGAPGGSAADRTHPGRLRSLRPGGRRDQQAGLLPGLHQPPAAAAPGGADPEQQRRGKNVASGSHVWR